MTTLFDPVEGDDPSPICPHCGVSALPPEMGEGSTCENADCEAFGEEIDSGTG